VESDGQGTCLTTRQCLLNMNRNIGLTQEEAERRLRDALGYEKVLWLDSGMANDHTDGHIDNLARFVAPGVVACPSASGSDDPNAALYDRVARALDRMSDARGRRLKVVRIPSPGRIVGADGEVIPASHMNFYISNTRVIMPTYEDVHSAAAVEALKPLFPHREVVPLRANNILLGGGSFHCITQNQ
jgi:agmatine deiminase